MLMAFNAFSPKANVYAHVGGFLAGIGLGVVLPRTPARGLIQLAAAVAVGAAFVVAWTIAG